MSEPKCVCVCFKKSITSHTHILKVVNNTWLVYVVLEMLYFLIINSNYRSEFLIFTLLNWAHF